MFVKTNQNVLFLEVINLAKLFLTTSFTEKAKKAQQLAMRYTVKNWGDAVITSVNRLKTKGN
jgi:hypothetical protein